ncbi:MAG: twin-arginine translocation signal domain-containing protein, partial [Bacteroidaceae bacterium]|nr:twin-arginine translocation signal domain-containing protein [Bacteroidaceae bacterium]
MKRRTFLRTSACGAAALAILGTNTQVYAAEKTISKNTTLKTPQREDPFHLGMAGWTFHKFNLQKT